MSIPSEPGAWPFYLTLEVAYSLFHCTLLAGAATRSAQGQQTIRFIAFTPEWEEQQGHGVRKAWGMGNFAEIILGKDNVPQCSTRKPFSQFSLIEIGSSCN